MKNYTLTLFLLCTYFGFAQKNVTHINAIIGIPDSLTNKNEIRIYKDYSISNSLDVFRIYKDSDKNRKAVLYRYYAAVGEQKERFDKTDLVFVHDPQFVWLSMMLFNVSELPGWNDIQYKLAKAKVVKERGEYSIVVFRSMSLDGMGYEVFTNNNHINYFNPESYLKEFPGVDELESFCGMLEVVKKEFKIWKDK